MQVALRGRFGGCLKAHVHGADGCIPTSYDAESGLVVYPFCGVRGPEQLAMNKGLTRELPRTDGLSSDL